jgi:hypothetical protein
MDHLAKTEKTQNQEDHNAKQPWDLWRGPTWSRLEGPFGKVIVCVGRVLGSRSLGAEKRHSTGGGNNAPREHHDYRLRGGGHHLVAGFTAVLG